MHTFSRKLLAVLLCVVMAASSAALLVQALEPSGNGVKIRNWVVNDPNYAFSDSYKTSVWYQNFDSLTLTENQRNNVLRIAVSQIGYHGGYAGDYSGTDTSADGADGKHIEYARLITPNWNDNTYDWCACFVNWCLNQARIDYCYGEISCWKWVEWLKPHDMFEDSEAYGGSYIPRPADMIFFNWSEVNTGASHIGYVLYVEGDTVHTVEGNSGNQVRLKSYKLNAKCIIGYGTPPYEEGDEPTMDFSHADGRPTGIYIVTSSPAQLTDKPANTSRIGLLRQGSTVKLLDTEGSFARVIGTTTKGETHVGYVPVGAICLMTPCEHTISFVAGNDTIQTQPIFTADDEITPPAVPEKTGYTGAWEEFTLGDGSQDVIVHPVYTPITYHATLEADGHVIATLPFTVKTMTLTLPAVPAKEGYTGTWEAYKLKPEDMTIHAVYTPVETQPAVTTTEAPTETATEAVTPPATSAPATEPPVTSPEEVSAGTSTEPTTNAPSATEDPEDPDDGILSFLGCNASVGMICALPLLIPAGMALRKRKPEDE